MFGECYNKKNSILLDTTPLLIKFQEKKIIDSLINTKKPFTAMAILGIQNATKTS
jgi:hypothetical protein